MSNIDKDKLEKLKRLLEIAKADKSPEERKKKIIELLKIVNEGLSRKEFTDSFKKVIEHVLKLEIKLVEKIDKVINELNSKNNTLLESTRGDLSDLHTKLEGLVDKALKEQENGLNFIRDKVRRIKEGIDGVDGINGLDGKNADEKSIIKEVLKQIKIPDNSNEIEQLREDLRQTRRLRGGGTSAIGVAHAFKYIAHTEKPSGVIDGANKVFTVAKNIFWVAGFTISNQQIAELPNFTIAGKTITFDLAIPAAFNDKDFEIKYIGS